MAPLYRPSEVDSVSRAGTGWTQGRVSSQILACEAPTTGELRFVGNAPGIGVSGFPVVSEVKTLGVMSMKVEK